MTSSSGSTRAMPMLALALHPPPSHRTGSARARCTADVTTSSLVPIFVVLGLILHWPAHYVVPRAIGLAAAVVFAWWYGSLRYQIHGGRCRTGDAILHALLMPCAWFMIAAVIVIFALGIVGLVLGLLR